ncbi:MAG: TerB family tellurite resistance protein [Bacteroidia bacterium]
MFVAKLLSLMTDKAKHLATFQNLCKIAFADEQWHEREKSLLQEAASSMGLEKEEIRDIMNQAADLDFVIPDNEGERYLELRMVVLMMVHDGNLDKREYAGCLEFAKRMDIEQTYLDEVIEFYQTKEQERIRHLGMFQNLYIVAAADGEIGPQEESLLLQIAENLGLGQRDVETVARKYPDFDFVIPDNKEEAYFSLKNLVFMMIADGKIKDREFSLCLRFAEMINMDREAVEKILDEYEEHRQVREGDPSEIQSYNIDIYLDCYNALKRIPLPEARLAETLEEAVIDLNFERVVGENKRDNRAFYDWLWLMHVRGAALSDDLRVVLPLYLNMVKHGSNFKPLLDYMLRVEQERAATMLPLPEMNLEGIKDDLQKSFAE